MKTFFLFTALLFLSAQAGELQFSGKSATIEGPSNKGQLRFDKDRFRSWHSDKSQPVWTFHAKQAGSVEVLIEYANPRDPGTQIDVSFGDTRSSFTIEKTKNWQTFTNHSLGVFHFKKGLQKLVVDPVNLGSGKAVMDMRNVTFKGDTEALTLIDLSPQKRPGQRQNLAGVHPSYKVTDLSPKDSTFKVTAIDFLSDGTMVLGLWNSRGEILLVNGYDGPKENMRVRRFAEGIAEPLGIAVVDDVIYVQQKQELTKLIDSNKDGVCDTFQCVSNAWDVSTNFHEFCFGPLYKDGYFYSALAIAVNPGGATTNPQVKDRGTLIKIDPKTGDYSVVSAGFRTPNGISFTADEKGILIADNQGDYLPANKLMLAQKGRFYNHTYNPPHPFTKKAISPPVVWMPHVEIANSPTDPIAIRDGVFKGQYLLGDIHHGGLRRVATEVVNGETQGTVFRFSRGLRGGTNRIAYGPNGNLYVGICGNRGNWGTGSRFGLLRLEPTGKQAFEIASIQTRSNGFTLTFTEPLAPNIGWDPAMYALDSFTYKPTEKYGGPKVDRHTLTVKSATVSSDRRQVFLETSPVKAGYLVHGVLHDAIINENKQTTWNAEWWTTVNHIPTDKPGLSTEPPALAVKIGVLPSHLTQEDKFATAKQIYAESCKSCHHTNSQKLVGPGLAKLFGKKQTVIRNGKEEVVTIDAEYLRNAIINPSKEHPKGYQPIMPNLGASMSKAEIEELVDWLQQLQ